MTTWRWLPRTTTKLTCWCTHTHSHKYLHINTLSIDTIKLHTISLLHPRLFCLLLSCVCIWQCVRKSVCVHLTESIYSDAKKSPEPFSDLLSVHKRYINKNTCMEADVDTNAHYTHLYSHTHYLITHVLFPALLTHFISHFGVLNSVAACRMR